MAHHPQHGWCKIALRAVLTQFQTVYGSTFFSGMILEFGGVLGKARLEFSIASSSLPSPGSQSVGADMPSVIPSDSVGYPTQMCYAVVQRLHGC